MMIVLCVFVTQPLLPKAATSDEIRQEIDQLEDKNDRLQQQIQQWEELLKDNLTQMSEIVRQKQIVDQQIFTLQESLQNSNQQIAAFALLIADNAPEPEVVQVGETVELYQSEQKAVILGLESFMCKDCRRLRHPHKLPFSGMI